MKCPNCGGTMLGDGYTQTLHCESTDLPPDSEADAPPIFCVKEVPVIKKWWAKIKRHIQQQMYVDAMRSIRESMEVFGFDLDNVSDEHLWAAIVSMSDKVKLAGLSMEDAAKGLRRVGEACKAGNSHAEKEVQVPFPTLLPQTFVVHGMALADGLTLFGIPLTLDLTKEELLAAAALGWNQVHEDRKERQRQS